ncbi:MAG: UbiA prenyltransferase family protein [Balneolaceae bacterium]|nr:UbiA prenyltransferase family protein [Balneolaceae bacterium]
MSVKQENTRPFLKQAGDFIIHLRWHYQMFILSGGFLLGGYLSPTVDWSPFLVQFLNVHLLLFGGATAYNSFWDKDEGPVGGLKDPPPMHRWMWGASLFLQFIGLMIALPAGLFFVLIYALSIVLFWLYSSPLFRWKGTPLRSLIAIGISTGTNSVLMGYLAAGNHILTSTSLIAAIGVALMVLSLYPVSQLYQLDEDMQRGDQTFSVQFGFAGVIRFFAVAFTSGVVLVALSIGQIQDWLGWTFCMIGIVVGAWIYNQFKSLKAEKDDYQTVMRIKYGTSMAFVVFLVLLLILKFYRMGMFA